MPFIEDGLRADRRSLGMTLRLEGVLTVGVGQLRKISLAIAAAFLLTGCAKSVNFPTAKIDRYDNDTQAVSGRLFQPKGDGPFPAVVLLHTCGGLIPHVLQDWPKFLTGLGYVAFTVDTYGPRGATFCTELLPWDRRQAQVKDAYGALDYLAKLPFVDGNRVGVMGFSEGAASINTYMMPRRSWPPDGNEFKAAIALYGGCSEIEHDKESIPLMVIIGEMDVRLAPSCKIISDLVPTVEVHILPGTYHAFDQSNKEGQADSGGNIMYYSGSAHQIAEELTKEFLAKHLR